MLVAKVKMKKIYKIKNVITKVKNLPKSKVYDIYYLDTSSIENNKILNLQHLIGEIPSRAKQVLCDGDIVYSQVRPYLNHHGIISCEESNIIGSTGFSVLRCNELVNNYYLYYLLQATRYFKQINLLAETTGSTYPVFSHSDFINLDILVESDISIQEKIGSFP